MMFKLITRLIGLIVIAGIISLALAMWDGGKPFRWLGIKSQRAGEVIKKKSEEIGEEADKIKKKFESIKNVTERVAGGIRKSGETIKDITGARNEK
jgi:hypothetical protein